MRRKRRRPFRGVLAKPLVRGHIAPEDIDERVAALLKHYAIDFYSIERTPEAAMTSLVLHLAQEIVPGFRVTEKGGRPGKRQQAKKRIRFSFQDQLNAWHIIEKFTEGERNTFPHIVEELCRQAEAIRKQRNGGRCYPQS